MDVAALVISIVALVLALVVAGFGVVLQFLMFKSSSEQTTHVAESLSGFNADLQSVIGELKGQTASMAGMQREQFNTMLDAFVRQPELVEDAGRVATQSARLSQDVLEKLEHLEAQVGNMKDSEALSREVEDIRRQMNSAVDSATDAARLVGEASVGRGHMNYWVRGFGPRPDGYKSFVYDIPALLREIKELNRKGERAERSKVREWHKPLVVEDPLDALNRALHEGLVRLDANSSIYLTSEGERLLEVIDAFDSGVLDSGVRTVAPQGDLPH